MENVHSNLLEMDLEIKDSEIATLRAELNIMAEHNKKMAAMLSELGDTIAINSDLRLSLQSMLSEIKALDLAKALLARVLKKSSWVIENGKDVWVGNTDIRTLMKEWEKYQQLYS